MKKYQKRKSDYMKTYCLINGEWIDIATDPRYIAYGNKLLQLYEQKNKALLKIIYPAFIECDNFSEGRALVKNINNQYGYLDKTGTLICPCQYQKALPYHNGVAIVYNGAYHVIDYNGNLIIKDNFINIEYCGDSDQYLQCDDEYGDSKLYIIKDLIGEFDYPKEEIKSQIAAYKLITGENRTFITDFYGDYSAFCLGGKWGIVDTHANVIEPFIHAQKIIPQDNMLIFIEDGILNIVNLETKERKKYDSRLFRQAWGYLLAQDNRPDIHVINVNNNCETPIEGIVCMNQNAISQGINKVKQKKKRQEKDNQNSTN